MEKKKCSFDTANKRERKIERTSYNMNYPCFSTVVI